MRLKRNKYKVAYSKFKTYNIGKLLLLWGVSSIG